MESSHPSAQSRIANGGTVQKDCHMGRERTVHPELSVCVEREQFPNTRVQGAQRTNTC